MQSQNTQVKRKVNETGGGPAPPPLKGALADMAEALGNTLSFTGFKGIDSENIEET